MFRIVGTPDDRVRRRLVRRGVRYFVGLVLIAVGVLAALPPVLVSSGALVLAIVGESPDVSSFPGRELAVLTGLLGLSVVCWWAGSRVIRGQRHLVLFLRRFGFTSATEALTFAVGAGLGRSWRLVTLDDHRIAPVGVRRSIRWIVWLMSLAAAGLTAAGLWLAVGAYESARDQTEADITNASSVKDAIGAAFAAAVLPVFVLTLLLVPIAVTATALIFLARGARSVRKAERSKSAVVTTDREVRRSVARARKMTRRVLAPRIIVVRVTNALWQKEVHALSPLVHAVLVDVSRPSKNLLWEIRTLEQVGARWLPIGRFDRLEAVQADTSPEAAELRDALGERWVLGYDPALLARFSDSLRTALELTTRGPAAPRSP